jgi:hypothetical protein
VVGCSAYGEELKRDRDIVASNFLVQICDCF